MTALFCSMQSYTLYLILISISFTLISISYTLQLELRPRVLSGSPWHWTPSCHPGFHDPDTSATATHSHSWSCSHCSGKCIFIVAAAAQIHVTLLAWQPPDLLNFSTATTARHVLLRLNSHNSGLVDCRLLSPTQEITCMWRRKWNSRI